MVTGSCCISGAPLVLVAPSALRKDIRPIYERMGIIPQAPLMEEGAEN